MVDLAPALAVVKQRLHDRGVTVFDSVPQGLIPSSFVLVDSKQLENVQGGVKLLKAVAIGLPLLVLALIAAAIGLSEGGGERCCRRRSVSPPRWQSSGSC